MPAYRKKITRQMTYEEFEQNIKEEENPLKQAFLCVLWFSGCRVSEALALTSDNIACTPDSIFVDFTRLKGSNQTDPIPLPRMTYLLPLCDREGMIFPWCRKTGYNVVRKIFPNLYPHFFRQNRFTDVAEKWPLATVVNFSGLNPLTVQHYIAKVDIRKVSKALKEEIT